MAVLEAIVFYLVTLAATLFLDRLVRPRAVRLRLWQGYLLHCLTVTVLFGIGLTISGSAIVAAALASGLVAFLAVASNAKIKMLGEPLVFSDLALLGFVIRHPRFYFTAISVRQRWMGAIVAVIVAAALALLFSPSLATHVAGVVVAILSGSLLVMLLNGRWPERLTPDPSLDADLARYGLVASLLLYWRRWRTTIDPLALTQISGDRHPGAPEIIVIVQCESFADPAEITGDPALRLPGLDRARAMACQWGKLAVNGFGAYTMRTEYGVLFGRDEAALGFRVYDPLLTAKGEASYALPVQLAPAGFRSVFVHPHDMRFYGRDRVMPAAGFAHLIDEQAFEPRPPGSGRYVDDRTLGAKIGELAEAASGRTLIYTVTMENHGPWDGNAASRLGAYLKRLSSSDHMLTELIDHLSHDGRPALLVFFGDHRPSIPGVVEPSAERHTPYVILRFGAGGTIVREAGSEIDMTPAALHHTVLDMVRKSTVPG